jgi:hypothetical protein
LSRDTLIPGAGFGSCFRLAGPGVLSSRWRVLPYLRCTAANAVGRSHTRIEVPSSRTWPWQSRLPGIRCALEMISSPHTVLCNRRAAHGERAREAPARGRGSPPAPDAGNRRRCQSQSEGPIKARGSGIGGLGGPPRSQPQLLAASRPSCAGFSCSCRVRRRAHPLCALRCAGPAPEQRLGGV